jgi:hypothetical protein
VHLDQAQNRCTKLLTSPCGGRMRAELESVWVGVWVSTSLGWVGGWVGLQPSRQQHEHQGAWVRGSLPVSALAWVHLHSSQGCRAARVKAEHAAVRAGDPGTLQPHIASFLKSYRFLLLVTKIKPKKYINKKYTKIHENPGGLLGGYSGAWGGAHDACCMGAWRRCIGDPHH